jgi:hypothetical protein
MAGTKTRTNSRSPRRYSVPTELRKKYGTKLVTRAVAAHILGISKSELIRREKDKIYPCITDASGRKWFDEDTLRNTPPGRRQAIKPLIPKESTTARYSGEVASIVFDGLSRGEELGAIIVTKAIHPEAALAIQEAYARVKGGLYLSKEDLELMGRLPFKATAWPPTKGRDLIALLESLLKAQECVRCHTKQAKVCASCLDEPPEQIASNGIPNYGKP